jgi:nicotinate-nucleotide adenylyltransferase
MTQSIAILGGTFDPIHHAHLALAHVLQNDLSFQSIAFVPCKQNPLKSMVNATNQQRVDMIELAIKPYKPYYYCDQLELERNSASYTIETLQSFRKLYPDASIAFTLGIDSFNSLHQWEEFEYFLDYVHLIVFPRPEHVLDKHPALKKLMHQKETHGIQELHDQKHGLIYFSNIPEHTISSTTIRSKLKANNLKQIHNHLPESVLNYINHHNLYKKKFS